MVECIATFTYFQWESLMDERMQAAAIATARQLLSNYKAEHPEWQDDRTPIDELSSWLGLDVETFHPNDYPEGTYGWLEPDEDLIWICRNLPETLRRFTLAHELGHALLHRHTEQGTPEPGRPQGIAPTIDGMEAEPWFGRGDPLRIPRPGDDEGAWPVTFSRTDPCQKPDVQEEVTGLTEEEYMQEVLGIDQPYDPRSQRELAANIFAAELLMPLERVRTLYLSQQVPASKLASIFGVSAVALLNRLTTLLKGNFFEILGKIPQLVGAGEVPGGVGQGGVGGAVALVAASVHSLPSSPPKKQYDEFQQAAIEAPTPALIVAGPGSGKTSTLIGRAEYLIHTQGVRPEHILALTFSRKAAQEMRERLQLALNVGVPLVGIPSMDAQPTVSTFHAFCAELLRNHSELVGLRPDFTLIDDTEGYFLLRRLARAMPLRHYRHLHSPTHHFPDMLKAISRAKDELVTPEHYRQLAERMREAAQDAEQIEEAEKALEVAEVYALYQEDLRQRGDTDFGGLIMLAVQLLQQHPAVLHEQQQQYQHILVDEFQDINRASGVLLRLLAGEEQRVWVVGDANQAIYGFRGASPANIANFQQEYPSAVVLPLNRNYRSRPDIVSISEAFRREKLEPGRDQGEKQTARPTHPDAYITLAVAPDGTSELSGLITDIRQKLAQGFTYQDIMILCRTRALAQKISRALAQAKLPVIERGNMLEQEYIQDLLSIVLLLAEPGGMGILRAARQKAHPLSQSDIEALLLAAYEQQIPPGILIARDEAPLTMSANGRRSLTRLSDILQTLYRAQNMWSALAQYLFIETSLVRDVLSTESPFTPKDGDSNIPTRRSILTDYIALLELARQYDRWRETSHLLHTPTLENHPATDNPPTIQEQAKGFLDYLNVLLMLRQDLGNRQQATNEVEENAEVIRIMTVHASKGLEFPVVYMPYLAQQRFPIRRTASSVSAPAGMLPEGSEGPVAHESGEACLFYVGVTRARDHVVLSYSERYGKQKTKRSPYLEALLPGLAANRITTVSWHTNLEDPTQPTHEEGSIENPPLSSQPTEDFIKAMKPPALKVSAIETYQDCPRRYLYSYIYRFQSEEGTYRLFWQATQKTIEALRKHLHPQTKEKNGQEQDRFPTREEIRELYTQHWQELGGHESPFALIYEQHGHEVVEHVWSELVANKEVKWELRQSYTVEIADKSIHGEIDRIEAPAKAGEPVKFVRTRFGKRKEKPEPKTRELLYARAYRQQYPGQDVELHEHNLSTGEMTPIKLTARKEASLHDDLEQAIGGLERDEYPAIPDAFRCPSCPFFLICPA
jgi:DNA helicase-2/ATP-dependent DNA helicase PcrA